MKHRRHVTWLTLRWAWKLDVSGVSSERRSWTGGRSRHETWPQLRSTAYMNIYIKLGGKLTSEEARWINVSVLDCYKAVPGSYPAPSAHYQNDRSTVVWPLRCDRGTWNTFTFKRGYIYIIIILSCIQNKGTSVRNTFCFWIKLVNWNAALSEAVHYQYKCLTV